MVVIMLHVARAHRPGLIRIVEDHLHRTRFLGFVGSGVDLLLLLGRSRSTTRSCRTLLDDAVAPRPGRLGRALSLLLRRLRLLLLRSSSLLILDIIVLIHRVVLLLVFSIGSLFPPLLGLDDFDHFDADTRSEEDVDPDFLRLGELISRAFDL